MKIPDRVLLASDYHACRLFFAEDGPFDRIIAPNGACAIEIARDLAPRPVLFERNVVKRTIPDRSFNRIKLSACRNIGDGAKLLKNAALSAQRTSPARQMR